MYISNINDHLNKLLKEKILPYYKSLTATSENNDKNNELIKEILLSLVTDQFYKDSLKETSELSFYSDDINIDKFLERIRPALVNRLISYGLPKNILEQFSTDELLLIYYNYYIIDKHKASVKQVKELFKLFNLNIISVAELYIGYDEQKDEPYFIPQWIYNPLNIKFRRISYEFVYNNTPGFFINKEQIKENKRNIIFPVKTNILFITSIKNSNLSTIQYLKAVYTLYKLRDIFIDFELPSSKIYELVNINDIPIILYYITLLYYNVEYISSGNRKYYNIIYNIPRILEYIETNENEFLKLLNDFEQYKDNSNNLYLTRKKFRQIRNLLTSDSELDNSKTLITREQLSEYIKNNYKQLYDELHYLFDVLRYTNKQKFENYFTALITNITRKLMNEFYKQIDNNQLDIVYFIAYLDYFFRFGLYLGNIVSLIIKKYILLVKFNLPAFIHIMEDYADISFYVNSISDTGYAYSTIDQIKVDIYKVYLNFTREIFQNQIFGKYYNDYRQKLDDENIEYVYLKHTDSRKYEYKYYTYTKITSLPNLIFSREKLDYITYIYHTESYKTILYATKIKINRMYKDQVEYKYKLSSIVLTKTLPQYYNTRHKHINRERIYEYERISITDIFNVNIQTKS